MHQYTHVHTYRIHFSIFHLVVTILKKFDKKMVGKSREREREGGKKKNILYRKQWHFKSETAKMKSYYKI